MASSPKEPPCYIVGLPDSAAEASAAKQKFERLSRELTKVLPSIEEIRAVVKSSNTEESRSRYEVSVEVYTPTQRHAYSETGYSLTRIFDSMEPKMKRLLSSRSSRVTSSRGRTQRKIPE
jgi:ribosome-associated translation inhibitor RaiA